VAAVGGYCWWCVTAVAVLLVVVCGSSGGLLLVVCDISGGRCWWCVAAVAVLLVVFLLLWVAEALLCRPRCVCACLADRCGIAKRKTVYKKRRVLLMATSVTMAAHADACVA
jgi:hypothetical protein